MQKQQEVGNLINQNEENVLMKIWSCKYCTYYNPLTQIYCQMCGALNSLRPKQIISMTTEEAYQQPQQIKPQPVAGIACRCGKINRFTSLKCISCSFDLSLMKYQEKKVETNTTKLGASSKLKQQQCLIPQKQRQKCPLCNRFVSRFNIQQHFETCKIQQILKMDNFDSQYQNFDPYDLSKAPKYFQNDKYFGRLTQTQGKAVQYIHKNSETLHNSAIVSFTKKMKNLGFSQEDLLKALHHLEFQAPLVIHFSLKRDIDFFIKDTNYRNRFQFTDRKAMQYRVVKQSCLFNKVYQNSQPYQRVKYGVINFTNDPFGVSTASSCYGTCFVLLKQTVRKRCSFTCGNSANNSIIGTLKYPSQVLTLFNDNQLNAFMDGAKGNQSPSTVVGGSYKQIQIHGPIQFTEDVQRIFINARQIQNDKSLIEKLEVFKKKFNVQYEFFQGYDINKKF